MKKFKSNLLISGTIISISLGVIFSYVFANHENSGIFSILISLITQIIVLILALIQGHENTLQKLETNNLELLDEFKRNSFFLKIQENILKLNDPVFMKKFEDVIWILKKLSWGEYSINNIDEIYMDDILHINQLEKGDKLYSTCPMSNKDV